MTAAYKVRHLAKIEWTTRSGEKSRTDLFGNTVSLGTAVNNELLAVLLPYPSGDVECFAIFLDLTRGFPLGEVSQCPFSSCCGSSQADDRC